MNGWLTIKTRLVNGELKKGLNEMVDSLKGAKGETMAMIKHFAKIALIVGVIVGIFKLIQGGIQTLLSRNEELANKIEGIKLAAQNLIGGIFTAVANLLEPVITRIVNLVYTFMAYLNAITKAWFGLDLFAKRTDKSLKSSSKSAKSTAKSLKEASKNMASFDEMNTLSDNSSSSGGGGGTSAGGGAVPDLSIPDVPIPGWIQWIIDHKDEVIAGLIGIASAIALVNFGLNAFMSIGIGMVIAGIVLLIKDIIDFINDPSWVKFGDILRDLAIILAGVAIAMLAVNAANPVAWIMLAIAAIVALVSAVITHWDKIKEVLGKVGKWIYETIIKPVGDFFAGLWDGIVKGVEGAVKWVKKTFNTVVSFFSTIISKIVNAFKKIGTKVGDTIGGAFKAVINGVLTAIEKILNFPIKSVNKLIGVINKVPGINIGKLPTFTLPRLARGGIVSNPGMGVNMGSYIAGERGAEAVLPLTDDTLQRLASMIPITIDLTNTIDGRVLNRRLETIRMNDSFAGNR